MGFPIAKHYFFYSRFVIINYIIQFLSFYISIVKTINQLNVAINHPQFLCLLVLDVEEVGDEGMSKVNI